VLLILTDTMTIVRAPLAAGYGNARTPDWDNATRTTVRGCVQPEGSSEQTGGQDRVATTHRVFLPATADVVATDRIEWGSGTYEVEGEPQRWPNPLGGGIHHIELTMSRTVGG
jgi:hypothetical protein